MFKCDILLYFQSGSVVKTLENKAAERCRIFGFDFPSRHFIFNALS